ncbi:MAG: hypothetical protein ACLQVI_16390 [Polyangiaceae bacterium]
MPETRATERVGQDAAAPRGCYASIVCIICVEFEKGKMTAKEARRALGEMVPRVGAEHAAEVDRMLGDAERRASPPKP